MGLPMLESHQPPHRRTKGLSLGSVARWTPHSKANPAVCTSLRSMSVYRASILELKGKTQIAAVPGITIDWDEVLLKIS